MKVLEKYGEVKILDVEDWGVPFYHVLKHELTSSEATLVEAVKKVVTENLDISLKSKDITDKKKRIFKNRVLKTIKERYPNVAAKRREVLADRVVQDVLGYGKIEVLLTDDSLEEIMVSGMRLPVFVAHRRYGACVTNISFDSDKELFDLITSIGVRTGKRIDFQQPLLDTKLSDGTRVNAVLPPIALDGPTITIRKFKQDPVTIIQLLLSNTISVEVAAFLWMCVDGIGLKPANLMVVGQTACGKTTTLNALLTFLPEEERVVVIEDTEELRLYHRNRARLETRPPGFSGHGEIDAEALMKNALRMRPDRIILGEVRGKEALTLFAAMNTGHDGCMGTLHANSADEVVTRITNPPLGVPKSLVRGLDIIVMQKRLYHRERGIMRRVTDVVEVSVDADGEIQLNKVYKYHIGDDELRPTGLPSHIQTRLEEMSKDLDLKVEDILLERQKILSKLAEGKYTQPDVMVKMARQHRKKYSLGTR